MRKVIIKILLCILAVATAFGVTACKKNDWKAPSLVNGGAVQSVGGFIAETDKYLYYINGSTSYGGDNTYGVPVKGSLMAADKASIKNGQLKTEIIVPKLFVSTDYNAGVYIYNGFVYYGTPSTDKNNAGEIAKSKMTFAKSNLNGKGQPETFFTVDSHSTEFRFVEKDGVVYLVYYKAQDKALILYNTNTKSESVIAKIDATTSSMETLGSYKFTKDVGKNDVVLLYTSTVYAEKYYEEAAKEEGYSRQQEAYNKVYAYSVGDGVDTANGGVLKGKVVLDGKEDTIEYTIDSIQYAEQANGEQVKYLFYTATDIWNEATKYAIEIGNFQNGSTKIVNEDYLDKQLVLASLDEVYFVVKEGEAPEGEEQTGLIKSYIAKTSLVKDDRESFTKVAEVGSESVLFAKKTESGKDFIYYYNNINELSRVELIESNGIDTEFNKQVRVSEGQVISSWYAPEFITIDEEEYLFYLDNSEKGFGYIKYVKLTGASVDSKDVDEDGEADEYFIKTDAGYKYLGKIAQSDYANMAATDLNKLVVFSWDSEKEVLVGVEELDNALASYNSLSPEAKELYGKDRLARLQDAQKAKKAAELLVGLEDIINYEMYDDAGKAQFKTAYDNAKSIMSEIKGNTAIEKLIDGNMLYNFFVKGASLFNK